MSFFSLRTLAVAGVFLTVAVSQASAVTVRYSGEFIVDNPVGSFDALDGELGTFFYEIDYSATDPEPVTFGGIIPNAVKGVGINIAGHEWIDTTTRDLEIGFSASDGFAFIVKGVDANFGGFPNVDFGLLAFFDPELVLANPLIKPGFNAAWGFLFDSDTDVSIVGADDPVTGFFSASGKLGSLNLVDPDPNPDPGNGQGGDPVTTVPVPAALPLMVGGLVAFFLVGRRRAKV